MSESYRLKPRGFSPTTIGQGKGITLSIFPHSGRYWPTTYTHHPLHCRFRHVEWPSATGRTDSRTGGARYSPRASLSRVPTYLRHLIIIISLPSTQIKLGSAQHINHYHLKNPWMEKPTRIFVSTFCYWYFYVLINTIGNYYIQPGVLIRIFAIYFKIMLINYP